MARILIRLVYAVGIAAAAVLILGLALFGFANTSPGQDWVASLVKPLTGGKVSVSGLRGRFLGSLRVAHVELNDKDGAWLTIDNVSMEWSPFALLGNRLEVARLDAGAASLLRRPRDGGETDDSDFRIDIAALKIAKFDTAPAISGRPATFTAQGSVRYASLRDARANLSLQRTDEPGSYRIDATLREGVVEGVVTIDEGSRGLLAALLDIEDIGPIALQAHASGPKDANAIAIALKAGALEASGTGVLDLNAERLSLDFSSHAPAMAPRPGFSWQSLEAEGHIAGAFSKPTVSAHLDVRNLVSDGNTAERASADATGANGAVNFSGTIAGLRLDGLDPKLFERAPIDFKGHAELAAPVRSVSATLSHPFIVIEGRFDYAQQRRASAAVTVSNLAPLSALAGIRLAGRASLSANATFYDHGVEIAAEGRVEATGGDETIIRLLGKDIGIALAATVEGANIAISNAQLTSSEIEARLNGTSANGSLDLNGTLSLADISRLAPGLSGNGRLRIGARGPWKRARVQVTGEGNIATGEFAKERITFAANADGLSIPLSGDFRAGGGFDGAPFTLGGSFAWAAGGSTLGIERAEWKSLRADGTATISDGEVSSGKASLQVGRLEDIAPFVGQAVQGRLEATFDLGVRKEMPAAGISAKLHDFRFDDIRAAEMTITGEILEPLGAPILALELDALSIEVAGIAAKANARVTGPLETLAVRLSSDVPKLGGGPAKLSAVATLRDMGKRILLSSFSGTYRGEMVELSAPTLIDLDAGIAVTDLRARVGKAEIAFKGTITPALNATASLRNLDADTLRLFIPQLAEGAIAGSAKLSGTLSAPEGTLDVQGRGLRLAGVPDGIARARADVHAELHGTTARLDAVIDAGAMTHLTLKGAAPLTMEQVFDLAAEGNVDLAMLNPVLSADGRNIRGKGAVNAVIGGTYAGTRITGTARVSGGEFQDVGRGIRVTDIALSAEASGGTVRIVNFTGRAGPGTISGNGTIDPNTEGLPVDISLTAKNARLVASDRLTATVNAELKLRGPLTQRFALSGSVEIVRAEVTLPESLPREVVVLNVLRSRTGPAPPRTPSRPTGATFDVTVTAPGQFYVRGRGLNAEVEGQIHAGGTDTAPTITGSFTLRRGTLSLAGQTLDFTSGKVSFDGASLRNRLDPTLDFEAQKMSSGVTALVAVTGYASSPRIRLSSTPSLPPDEVLARLIFQQSASQLSPLQLAEIAQAAAALGGVGTGFNPVAFIRESLGLDRLSVGSTKNPGGEMGTAVEAGKYVTRRVYVGTKQGLSGGTQAEVQIDLTKNLKAQGTVNTGSNAAVTQGAAHDQIGTSVGLSFQFEY